MELGSLDQFRIGYVWMRKFDSLETMRVENRWFCLVCAGFYRWVFIDLTTKTNSILCLLRG